MAQKEKTLQDFKKSVNYDTLTTSISSTIYNDDSLLDIRSEILEKITSHYRTLGIKTFEPKDTDIFFSICQGDVYAYVIAPNETEENKKSRIKNEEILAEKEYNKYLERKERAKNHKINYKKKLYEKLKEELAALEKELK